MKPCQPANPAASRYETTRQVLAHNPGWPKLQVPLGMVPLETQRSQPAMALQIDATGKQVFKYLLSAGRRPADT